MFDQSKTHLCKYPVNPFGNERVWMPVRVERLSFPLETRASVLPTTQHPGTKPTWVDAEDIVYSGKEVLIDGEKWTVETVDPKDRVVIVRSADGDQVKPLDVDEWHSPRQSVKKIEDDPAEMLVKIMHNENLPDDARRAAYRALVEMASHAVDVLRFLVKTTDHYARYEFAVEAYDPDKLMTHLSGMLKVVPPSDTSKCEPILKLMKHVAPRLNAPKAEYFTELIIVLQSHTQTPSNRAVAALALSNHVEILEKNVKVLVYFFTEQYDRLAEIGDGAVPVLKDLSDNAKQESIIKNLIAALAHIKSKFSIECLYWIMDRHPIFSTLTVSAIAEVLKPEPEPEVEPDLAPAPEPEPEPTPEPPAPRSQTTRLLVFEPGWNTEDHEHKIDELRHDGWTLVSVNAAGGDEMHIVQMWERTDDQTPGCRNATTDVMMSVPGSAMALKDAYMGEFIRDVYSVGNAAYNHALGAVTVEADQS